ncbi:MAG: hypothetical protein AB8G95_28450 [Anaerolineae bacterium]
MADLNLKSERVESVREFLFGVPMFAGIPDLPMPRGAEQTPAAEFLSICQEFRFERDAVIAYSLDIAQGMYIFRSGTVDGYNVSFNNELRKQEFQWDRQFTSGQILGDKWLFESGQHHQLLKARKTGSFILIPKKDFLKFIAKYKVVLRQMQPHMTAAALDEVYRSGMSSYLKPAGSREQRNAQALDDQAELVSEDGATQQSLPAPVQKIKLLPDERIFYHSQRSWKIASLRIGVGIVLALILLIITFFLLSISGLNPIYSALIGLGAAAIPLLNTLVYWVDWRNAFFLVTSNQLIRSEKRLLQFNSALEKIDINKVQSISIEKTNFLQKWFNVGTAQITTAAQGSVLYFDYVDDPDEVEKAVQSVLQSYSLLEKGKRRAELRSIINSHYGVQSQVKKVPQIKSPPKPKTMWERFRENFVRSEGRDGITYHKHPIALVRFMVGPTLASLFLIIVWYGLGFFEVGRALLEIPALTGIMIILSLGTLFWFWWEFEDWHNDTFQITNQYIYDIDRLPLGLSESRKQAELNRIENVRTEKDGFLPTLFNYGAVHVETAGAENNIVFENVKDPDAVQATIFKKRSEYENMLAKRGTAGNLDMITTLAEMLSEAEAQKRAWKYQPLPEANDDFDEEYD